MKITTEELIARINIEEQIYAYAIALDEKNWEGLNHVFTEDAETIYGSKNSTAPFVPCISNPISNFLPIPILLELITPNAPL